MRNALGDSAAGDPTVYVMGAYIPAGGTRMAYEIGLVAHQALGYPCKVIQCGQESFATSVFEYPVEFDVVRLENLSKLIRPKDLLICNPSFSDGLLGLTYSCRKLMYVQGFNTFSTLDCWFDRYVAVSGFVQDFLANTYGRKPRVINPFLTMKSVSCEPWWNRPVNSVWFYLKGSASLQRALLERLKLEVKKIDSTVAGNIDWDNSILCAGQYSQSELHEKLTERRHFVSLSVCEGFGLVPLEAMALGTTVLGFDGFGGRDYMLRDENCLVRPYPNLVGVAEDVVTCLKDPVRAAAFADSARSTGALFARERFHQEWKIELMQMTQHPCSP